MLFSIGGLLSNLFEFQVTSWQKLWLWQRLVTSGLSDLGTNHFKNPSWRVRCCVLRIKDPDQLATSLFTVNFASPGLHCMGTKMVTPSFPCNTSGSKICKDDEASVGMPCTARAKMASRMLWLHWLWGPELRKIASTTYPESYPRTEHRVSQVNTVPCDT